MKNKVFFLAISVLLLMISCQKSPDKQEENNDFFSVFSRDDLSGITSSADVSIFANGIFGTIGNPSIGLSGRFKNSNGNRIQVERFRINGIDIPLSGQENSNYYDLFVPSNHELSNTINGFFGSNVTVDIQSLALGNFTKTFYLPQKVQMSIGGLSEELPKSQNLGITWNADPQNTLPVAILVAYNKGKSRHVNPNLPNQDLQVFRIVPDNGTYTIPSSDLQIFPTGGLVTVNVIRGIQEHMENSNGNHAIINGAAYITTIEFEVVN